MVSGKFRLWMDLILTKLQWVRCESRHRWPDSLGSLMEGRTKMKAKAKTAAKKPAAKAAKKAPAKKKKK